MTTITTCNTNGKCSIYDQDKDICLKAFKTVITDLESLQGSYQYTLDELLQAQQTCRHEIARDHPQALLAALQNNQKQEETKCKQTNLNADDTYACKRRPQDIKMLKEMIQKRS